MPRPTADEYAPFYAAYVGLVRETDVLAAMASQLDDMLTVLRPVPEAEGAVKHAPYTWTIKDVVGHIADTERVFGYRALCFARGDETPLPGFDENLYARTGEFERIPLGELVDELEAVRRSHLALFRHLPAEAWGRVGTANNNPVTVRALAYIITGHARHHTAILKERLGR